MRAGVRLVQKVIDKVSGEVRNKVHNYSNKDGVAHKEIIIPEGFEKEGWLKDRQELWQKVEDCENRKDAQLARQIVLALPKELTEEENIELAVKYAKEVLAKEGMIVDVAVHYDNPQNPHAHLLMTMRNLEIDEAGRVFFGAKNRQWNEKQKIAQWRGSWEQYVNYELQLRGIEDTISSDSFETRGLDLVATKHEGKTRHIERVQRIKEFNRMAQEVNLQAVRDNPEVLIDMLQSKKGLFDKDDIVLNFKKILFEGQEVQRHEHLEGELVQGIEGILNSEKLVRVTENSFGGRVLYAGRSQVEKEKKMIEAATQLKNRYGHIVSLADDQVIDEHLSDQQQQVVKGVLEAGDLAIIQGLPGAGKSTIARRIAQEYEKLGYRVSGTAVTAAACKNLHEITEIKVQTIASIKTKWSWLERNGATIDFGVNDVLVIDEMSMVSLDDFSYLLGMAASKGAKVIALGDVNQFAAIKDHGAAARLQRIGEVFVLDKIQRMQIKEHRQAAEALADKRIGEALELLDKQDVFKLLSSKEIARENLVLEFVSRYGELMNASKSKHLSLSKQIVALAHTNKEVRYLNQLIRNELKALGVLAKDDQEIKVGSKRLALGVGEQVVFGSNNKELGVINGDVGVIKEISRSGEYVGGRYGSLKIELKGGKSVSINTKEYGDINYGYALTAYKGQGGSYDHVFVMHEKIIRYEGFNVMITRHRKSLGVYLNEEDLGIRSVLDINKHSEVVQRLTKSLSSGNNKGLVSDYNFESQEAKNIQYYLGLKAEVKQEIELIKEWKQKQTIEKGLVPDLSQYKNVEGFGHKLALRKESARVILSSFEKHEKLASIAKVSKSVFERHADTKDKQNQISYFKLVGDNWKERVQGLTDRWLDHQDALIDLLATKELELSSLQLEDEVDKLKFKYLNHYKQAHEIYLKEIYKDSYLDLCDKWRVLCDKHGTDKLVEMVNKKPELLGAFKGKIGLFGRDEARAEAMRLAKNLGENMHIASTNGAERDFHNIAISKKSLGNKIEELGKEVQDLEEQVVDKLDYGFMAGLKRLPESLEQKQILSKWQSLAAPCKVIEKSDLEGLLEEVASKEGNSLFRNIWRYKSVQRNLHDMAFRISTWQEKEKLEYPGSELFLQYREELLKLKSEIVSKAGWQAAAKQRGLPVEVLMGQNFKLKTELLKSLSKKSLEGIEHKISNLALICLDEQVRIYEKLICSTKVFYELKRDLESKENELDILQKKREGEFENIGKVYQLDSKTIFDNFKKLQTKETEQALSMVNDDPQILGTLKGFGIGKVVMTLSRLHAEELSHNVANSIGNILKLDVTEKNLQQNILKNNYAKKIEDLGDEMFNSGMQRLHSSDLQDLSKLRDKDFTENNLKTIERIFDKKINYSKLLNLMPLKSQEFEKKQVIKFEDIARQLRSHDYENIFRQYANIIVGDKSKIQVHGSNISCGSLNMNLDNGIWIRFSTGEKGNIFHFTQAGAGVDKMRSLEIVASRIGYVGLNANFVPKEQLHFVQDEEKQKRLVPVVFKDELTLEVFEKHFAYLCKENKLEALHKYCGSSGSVKGYTVRLVNTLDGRKQVLPVACLYDRELNRTKIALKAFSDQKLIYGLEKLYDNKTVLIVEGEKTADRAQQLFPEMNVISWLGGTNSAHKVDWGAASNKQVIIWPDNDEVGTKAAEVISDKLIELGSSKEKVIIAKVQGLDLPEKWDLADKLPEHLTFDGLRKLACIHENYSFDEIKRQAKELEQGLEQKLQKLLDPNDSLKVYLHSDLQKYKHPRLSKEIVQNMSMQYTFEETIKHNVVALSQEQLENISSRLEFELEHIAYNYETQSYDKIQLNPKSFREFYSKEGPNNSFLLQEVRSQASYQWRLYEIGERDINKDIKDDFDKALDRAFKDSSLVKELNEIDKNAAQSLAEQIADYELKFGLNALTTKRLEMMHQIALDESQYLVKALQKQIDSNHNLELKNEHFQETIKETGHIFRDHMMLEHIQHDGFQEAHKQMHYDHSLNHSQAFADHLAQKAIQNHLDDMHRKQLEHKLTLQHTLQQDFHL